MATMVKEKRREKKKPKDKSRIKDIVAEENLAIVSETISVEPGPECSKKAELDVDNPNALNINVENVTESESIPQYIKESDKIAGIEKCVTVSSDTLQPLEVKLSEYVPNTLTPEFVCTDQVMISKSVENVTDNYEYLNSKLQRIAIPQQFEVLSEVRELELIDSNAYLKPSEAQDVLETNPNENGIDNMLPSAPIFEEQFENSPQVRHQENIVEAMPKLQCMTIEEAMNMFGGTEMAAVKMMSEREQAIVQLEPATGPEHPLVDLLSTFKSSLRALENERARLTCAYADEEKSRSTLWKIEKRYINKKKLCRCGANVEMRASYEHAELLKARMPVARLKLEGLLRDICDSYCHHQHAALLAHCQIEELISETINSSKVAIREALSLVLQALRMCEEWVTALPVALQRWAAALAAALIDERDISTLLFLLHHLFRQSRSVRWVARVFRPRVPDSVTAARLLAVIDTLLSNPRLDPALECTEHDTDEGWEEVSSRGAGGAVSEGALREIDLLALLHAFPLRDLLARILLFTHSDIRDARTYEWGDARGGYDVLYACSGVRTLLAVLQRATDVHSNYVRLRRKLRVIATSVLKALFCLYQSPRAPYHPELQEKIQVELEACFKAAFHLFGTEDLHRLETSLLAESTAKDYCLTYMIGLHDTTPREIDSLLLYAPVLACSVRVRILTSAAQRRLRDHELARIVLDFLLQTGGKAESPSASCRGGCAAVAREQLAHLLTAHPYLRTVALYAVAELAQISSLDPSLVSSLKVEDWRPQPEELQPILEQWPQRCPQLLHKLLLQLDCTPHTGVSLPTQLYLAAWLCEYHRSKPANAELCWRVLLRLLTHATWWGMETDAPAPEREPTELFEQAHALLATSWGHCIPLICSRGVSALCALSVRPRMAVHCLAPVMLLMAHSHESISLTPQFTELFTSLLNSGPSLVQRAFGRGGDSGPELLLRLVLSQIERERQNGNREVSIFRAWLHALCRVPLRSAAATLDAAALAALDWPALDAHAACLMQEENYKEHATSAVRNASVAPLLAECSLRACHTHREINTQMFATLANLLWEQRVNGQRIHVDNALQKIKADVSSEELVIYRCSNAALVAPLSHPAHLTLWRLFFHLYLQRPPSNMRDTGLPVGPLFFSGLLKSRTLTHLIKRLQETITYHHNEAENYKKDESQPNQSSSRIVKSESITTEKAFLPELSIKDLTGESDSCGEDSDMSEESDENSNSVETEKEDVTSEEDRKHALNMRNYHTSAERMVREFCTWLEEGDRVRASSHHADIARFIPEQALETAWKDALSRSRPLPSEELDDFPRPTLPPHTPLERDVSPLDDALRSIMKIKDKSGVRSRRLLKSPIENVDVLNARVLTNNIDKQLKNIATFAKEWSREVNRISSLDGELWELVSKLRVARSVPPVTALCPNARANKCRPTLFCIEEQEWCISTGAERSIKDNRSSWVRAVRTLSAARPAAARSAAALLSIARRIRDKVSAVSCVELVWRAAGACADHGPARSALGAAAQILAERWIQHDGDTVVEMLSRWCGECSTPLQQTLCGALLSPRRLAPDKWARVYSALLHATLPSHIVFSYLSKFELSQWSRSASPASRSELLSTLISGQSKFGASPAPEHCLLLELLPVHMTCVLNVDLLCSAVMKFAQLAADNKLPPRQWTHLLTSVEAHSDAVSFDQLGNLLRSLQHLWCLSRSLQARHLASHSEGVGAVQARLARALLAAATALRYTPERVGVCVWSALVESFSPWLAPHPSTPPLLPALSASDGDGEYTRMLRLFHTCLLDVIVECPGCEISILQGVFEWCVSCHVACLSGSRQEARLQSSELLATLATLPWTSHQWFYGRCLDIAMQVCASNDREIMSWCCSRWCDTDAVTLLRDVTDDTLASRLVTLLYLLTSVPLRHQQHILEEARRLPWRRLPEEAFSDALDRFFAAYHDCAVPYHDLPQFQVILAASLLVSDGPCDAAAEPRDRRARAASAWSRAAAAPALLTHVATHARAILTTITNLAPNLEESNGELEDLLSRASVIMCLEPAAAAALPVWQAWVRAAPARVMRACVSCACALTAPAYCALLADTAVQAYFTTNEASWSDVVSRWRSRSPWREPQEFASRACLHAAYACAVAFHQSQPPPATLRALLTTTIDFEANEAIVAVWICYVCRVAAACATSATCATSDGQEFVEDARALLRAWAAPPRRSLLRVVTLQRDKERTTTLHRVVCRLAEYLLCPSAGAKEAYELACAGAGCGDVTCGSLARLPRLAARLHPAAERYFAHEISETSDT